MLEPSLQRTNISQHNDCIGILFFTPIYFVFPLQTFLWHFLVFTLGFIIIVVVVIIYFADWTHIPFCIICPMDYVGDSKTLIDLSFFVLIIKSKTRVGWHTCFCLWARTKGLLLISNNVRGRNLSLQSVSTLQWADTDPRSPQSLVKQMLKSLDSYIPLKYLRLLPKVSPNLWGMDRSRGETH